MNQDKYPALLKNAIANNDEQQALSLYADWFKTYESVQLVRSEWSRAHLSHAASLARKSFYYQLNTHCTGMPRASAALEHFVGLKRYSLTDDLQKPSFLFYPGLPARPFYKVEEVSGLEALVKDISNQLVGLNRIGSGSKVSYADHIGSVPNSSDWQKLKTDWQSQHFISGGEAKALMKSMPLAFQCAFKNPLIPDCPPFSPEVFISSLEPDTYIPPHYGISNVKLTVHIPIEVTSKAWLKAGSEVFCWRDGDSSMVFDDSFLHSAKNEDEQVRSVLIFDIWHPDLSVEEQAFIQRFMKVHSHWDQECGFLAGLDKGLYVNAT